MVTLFNNRSRHIDWAIALLETTERDYPEPPLRRHSTAPRLAMKPAICADRTNRLPPGGIPFLAWYAFQDDTESLFTR